MNAAAQKAEPPREAPKAGTRLRPIFAPSNQAKTMAGSALSRTLPNNHGLFSLAV
jgi:hypothetical protein